MQSIQGEYTQYKEYRDKSRNYTDVVGTALSIASIVFGILIYIRKDCEGMPMVPICMIGSGAHFIVGTFLSRLVDQMGTRDTPIGSYITTTLFWGGIFVWFLLGTYFVMGSSRDNCDKTAYTYAYAILILGWIVAALVGVGICFKSACAFLGCGNTTTQGRAV